jgi:hypothetical protein
MEATEIQPHIVRPLPDENDPLNQEAHRLHREATDTNQELKSELAALKSQVSMQNEPPPPPPQEVNPDTMPVPAPAFEPLDFDNLTPREVAEEQERRFEAKLEHQRMERERENRVLQYQQQEAEEEKKIDVERKEIKTFVDNTPDFGTYQDQVRTLYGQPMSVEQAYYAARIQEAGGLEKLLESAAPSAYQDLSPRSAIRASDSQNTARTPKAYGSSEDAAGAAWDTVVGTDSGAMDALNSSI